MFFLIYLACGFYLWLLGAAVFGGWETGRSLFRAPWLGYAVLIACLQIAHIFTAINPAFSWTFLAISSLCAGGIVALRFRGIGFQAKELPAMSPLVWFALLIAVAWLAFRPVFNIATQKIVHYDVGYYYLQTIAWTTAFPIVPGLGNLLLELGFNQAAFLVPSLFDSLGPHLWGYSLLGRSPALAWPYPFRFRAGPGAVCGVRNAETARTDREGVCDLPAGMDLHSAHK